MQSIKETDNKHQPLFIKTLSILAFLLVCRLIANWLIPLNDVTEARYGEIARKMLETGNWVTPLHDYGVPFWAKPPLSTWLSALSMTVFGINEFAVRLPGLLLSMGVLWLVWGLAKKHSGAITAMFAVVVLAGSLDFFLDAGAVMTDPSLLFCITLAQVAFWYAMVDKHRGWSYLFFVGLGLGLLAKGPIALVIVGLNVFFWVLIRNEWLNLWKRLPWIKGTLLMLAIALPWYIIAEQRTPGFLNYFLVGEHFHRFVNPGWTGDKYGMAHDEPWGMIWVFAVAGVFPWSILGCLWLGRFWRRLPEFCRDSDGWVLFILIGTLAPLCFFTFASNIIYPYVIPALPAFSLYFAEMWSRSYSSLEPSKWIFRSAVVVGSLFLISAIVIEIKPDLAKSQKDVIAAWQKQHPTTGSHLVYWDLVKIFSAEFYSHGLVSVANDKNSLCHLISNQKDNYIVVNTKLLSQVPEELLKQLTEIETIRLNGSTMKLMKSPAMVNCIS